MSNYKPTNREKKLATRTGVFWCRCDANQVGPWEKCSVCKSRNPSYRLKRNFVLNKNCREM